MCHVTVTENIDGTYQIFISGARMFQNYIVESGSTKDKIRIETPDIGIWADLMVAEVEGVEGFARVKTNGMTFEIADGIWQEVYDAFHLVLKPELDI